MYPKIENVKFSDWIDENCTYFTTNDCSPIVSDDGQTIKMLNGYGARRSWGSPKVTSNVEWMLTDIVAIDVTGWHKHSVSPEGGTYYFVYSHKDGKWLRKRANAKAVAAAIEYVEQLQRQGFRFDYTAHQWRNASNELIDIEALDAIGA
jgi:hypothetical protein